VQFAAENNQHLLVAENNQHLLVAENNHPEVIFIEVCKKQKFKAWLIPSPILGPIASWVPTAEDL
jgi:hypothetical protein